VTGVRVLAVAVLTGPAAQRFRETALVSICGEAVVDAAARVALGTLDAVPDTERDEFD
jgi:hypothetical protein